MAWQWAAFLANMQQRRFSSSDPVTAMNTSVCSMPASESTAMEEQLPVTPMTSRSSVMRWIFSAFLSTTVTLCPSALSWRVSAAPTLPQPTTMILIGTLP